MSTMRATVPQRRSRIRSTVSVGLVLALAGLMFTASARLSRGQDGRQPEDLAHLVEQESDEVARLSTTADALSDEIAALGAKDSTGTSIEPSPTDLDVAAGSVPVTGSGLTVTLDDAPRNGTYGPDVRPDDLVVHQQDIQAVVNALWSGGAEAMTLQGQRVTATSAFRCAGNILLLHGRVFSPPYVVQAVGDPQRLRAALQGSPQLSVYREWVDAVRLGWDVEDSSKLDLPRYEGALELKYARVDDKPESP